ncbi:NADH dehydrogenase [ubiquinone] 1 beta subcomplex subunit 2, mitochondrial-like [Antedon mediterranea]|uniref:NADH dehydrogenase [ubiquinone] 1 beta subcomplex subunit 2, mitochondrial-like n=1 Tax=Antedon mediterranea TaxID=105859 RepID=UPI003AF9D76D
MFGISRIRQSLRIASRYSKNVRNMSGSPVYRGANHPGRREYFIGEFLAGSMWFWIMWRFYHEPEDVLGHFPYPDPSEWTNEELGIPPDDED